MQLDDFNRLLEEDGERAIEAAAALDPSERDFLQYYQTLQRTFPSELARPALETAILRKEAITKFPFADRMFFIREALEQASSHEVSSYRADRYKEFPRLADLGCSIGGDTITMSRVAPTIGVDRDRLRLAMARQNLNNLGLLENTILVQHEISEELPFAADKGLALFCDPSRREAGRRIFSVQRYQPALKTVLAWQQRFQAIGVKISPGVDVDELGDCDAEIEFISYKGALKEAMLWFGPLRRNARKATILPGPHTMESDESFRVIHSQFERFKTDFQGVDPQEYLYEPDPAIIRTGMVRTLGKHLNAHQMDPHIAYLTASKEIASAFARVWKIIDWMPFNLKKLRRYLREHRVGQVVVKKRGSPIQPEELIRMLRLEGEVNRVLFLTQLRGKPIVIICMQNLDH